MVKRNKFQKNRIRKVEILCQCGEIRAIFKKLIKITMASILNNKLNRKWLTKSQSDEYKIPWASPQLIGRQHLLNLYFRWNCSL